MYNDHEVYLFLYFGQAWRHMWRHTTVLLSICSSLIMYLYRFIFNAFTFLHLFVLTRLNKWQTLCLHHCVEVKIKYVKNKHNPNVLNIHHCFSRKTNLTPQINTPSNLRYFTQKITRSFPYQAKIQWTKTT